MNNTNEKSEGPTFSSILQELSNTATQAQKQSDSDEALDDWLIQSIELLTKSVSSPVKQVQALKVSMQATTVIQEMCSEHKEQKDMGQIYALNKSISEKVPELMKLYVEQRSKLDKNNHVTKDEITSGTFENLRQQISTFQTEIVQDGFKKEDNQELFKAMEVLSQQDYLSKIDAPQADQLKKNRSFFKAKQIQVEKSLKEALIAIQKEEAYNIIPTKTRELLVYECNSDKPSTPFFMKNDEQKISYLKAYTSETVIVDPFENTTKRYCGITGIEAIMQDGTSKGPYGKNSNKHPTHNKVKLNQSLKSISIASEGFFLHELQFLFQEETRKLKSSTSTKNIKTFELDEKEIVIGIYGKSFDDPTFGFSKLGFIIGTLFDENEVAQILMKMPANGEKIAEYYDTLDPQVYEICMNAMGFNDHHHIANSLAIKIGLDRKSKILDLGCGTGIMGRLLSPHGFTEIDGIDATGHFVTTSEESGYYNKCHELWLGQGIEKFPKEFHGKYDCVMGSGVYMKGHFPARALEDHVEATRPGGIIIFGLRDTYWVDGEELGFKDKFNELVAAGKLNPTAVIDFKYKRGMKEAKNKLYQPCWGRILAFKRK